MVQRERSVHCPSSGRRIQPPLGARVESGPMGCSAPTCPDPANRKQLARSPIHLARGASPAPAPPCQCTAPAARPPEIGCQDTVRPGPPQPGRPRRRTRPRQQLLQQQWGRAAALPFIENVGRPSVDEHIPGALGIARLSLAGRHRSPQLQAPATCKGCRPPVRVATLRAAAAGCLADGLPTRRRAGGPGVSRSTGRTPRSCWQKHQVARNFLPDLRRRQLPSPGSWKKRAKLCG